MQALRWVFGLTAGFMFLEWFGGVFSGSLALMADAAHMLGDATSLGMALFAAWFAHLKAPPDKTFGYGRVEILVALFNGLLLVGIAAGILTQGLLRLGHPAPIQAGLMFVVALGGLVVNIVGVRLLHDDHHHNLNMRGAYLHVLSDLLGSVGAIAASVMVGVFHLLWADPLISLVIAVFVTISAVRLIRDAFNILLEGTPPDLSLPGIQQAILALPGVLAVHNLHVWQINVSQSLLTAHVLVQPEAYSAETLSRLQHTLRRDFHLAHCTLQMELADPAG